MQGNIGKKIHSVEVLDLVSSSSEPEDLVGLYRLMGNTSGDSLPSEFRISGVL